MKPLKRLLGKPDKDDFAQMVTDEMLRAGNTDSIEFDRGSLMLVVAGG